jgi:hypothetical protein
MKFADNSVRKPVIAQSLQKAFQIAMGFPSNLDGNKNVFTRPYSPIVSVTIKDLVQGVLVTVINQVLIRSSSNRLITNSDNSK